MYEVELKVDDRKFQEWIFGVHHLFKEMVQTMIDIHNLIMANMNTKSLIPLDFGYLEQSYHYNLVRSDDTFIELHSVFDAVDPESGFHYAEYQHDLKRVKHGEDYYHSGSPSYYWSALHGNPKGNHHRHGVRGKDHYLLEGVQASETMMWTLIEQDYLSLFFGGIK